MRAGVVAIGVAAAMAVGGSALAQGNPSADQIINSLRPSGSMMGGTRGIRPVTPGATAPPPAASPSPSAAAPAAAPASAPRATPASAGAGATPPRRPAAEASAAPPSVDLSVQFASGSAELTPAAVTTLTALGQALSSSTLGSYRFRIEGHTDTVGGAAANKALSERRARAVVGFLEQRFGIDGARLDAVGMGEDGLLVQTPPETAEPRNRRVQVINLGA